MKLSKKNDQDYQYLSEEKVKYAEVHLQDDAEFLELLNTAIDVCIENDRGNYYLENLAAAFISKKESAGAKATSHCSGTLQSGFISQTSRT